VAGLTDILRQRIEDRGPMTLEQYMAEALGHYYGGADRLGRSGDFITAPEISQLFGELIGLWSAVVWQSMGSPDEVVLAELGPGRGTLMADALRAAAMVPGFRRAIRLHLVERSPGFRERQAEALADADPTWHSEAETLPGGPVILIANEFLDALPVRQFIRTEQGWRERTVEWGTDAFEFGVLDAVPSVWLPADAEIGAIAEDCPAGRSLAAALGRRVASEGGVALIVDYGYGETALGESLQAVRGHAFHPVLADPGEADLTAHVDFAALGSAAREAGAMVYGPLAQGEFLRRLGIDLRLAKLLETATPEQAEDLRSGYRRLVDPGAMGRLFKVLAIAQPGLIVPAI
jgi:NADH dehydrogenase [ubiquinone] 1 alpha subcomplex assembly factor 7